MTHRLLQASLCMKTLLRSRLSQGFFHQPYITALKGRFNATTAPELLCCIMDCCRPVPDCCCNGLQQQLGNAALRQAREGLHLDCCKQTGPCCFKQGQELCLAACSSQQGAAVVSAKKSDMLMTCECYLLNCLRMILELAAAAAAAAASWMALAVQARAGTLSGYLHRSSVCRHSLAGKVASG